MKYRKKESSTLEFKRDIPKNQQIVKSIIGFCNMYGGTLLVGVDDTGEIIGVDETNIDELMENINQSVYSSCTPTIIPAIHTQRIENKVVLAIEVSEGMTKPYYVTSLGINEGTYVRIGPQTVKANPQIIRELQWQSTGRYADEMPVYHGNVDDLDFDAFQDFIRNRKQYTSDANIEDMMIHYDIIIKEHTRLYPSTGGLLLFGKDPQRLITESFIICTHFAGTSGRDVIATRDCTGTLIQQYRDATTFVFNRLNKQFTIEGMGPRKQGLEVPEEAIREVIMNAIVHRNYHIPGPTKVAIYDDRVEVFSPGNFPGPIQIDHLQMGVTYIRNFVVTRVFRDIGLMEKLGSGFLTLFESYRQRNLPHPTVYEGTGFVKCILPRPVSHGQITPQEDENELLQLFYLKETVKTPDVMAHLGVSRATAGRLLKVLLENGRITRKGKGPSTFYKLKT